MKKDEAAACEMRRLYRSYGYTQFKMSRFEEYDLYVRNKDFLISDNIITFNDTDGRLMAMKPDVTLSIIKNSEYKKGCVQKVYYNENVYRVPKGSRSFKEIMQVGLEKALKEYRRILSLIFLSLTLFRRWLTVLDLTAGRLPRCTSA